MSEEMLSLMALCVSIPVAVGYYKKVVGGNSKHDRFIQKAKRNRCVTTGVCVHTEYWPGDPEAKSLEDRSGAIEAKYQYQVDGVDYYKRLLFRDPGSINIHYPSSIELYYDKNKPKKAVSPVEFSAQTRKQSGCFGAVLIWFLLMLILVNGLKLLIRMVGYPIW